MACSLPCNLRKLGTDSMDRLQLCCQSFENLESWNQESNENTRKKAKQTAISLEAIAIRLEAIASREAVAGRLEAITSRLEAIASRLEAIALRLTAIALRLEAIALRLEAITIRLDAITIMPSLILGLRQSLLGWRPNKHLCSGWLRDELAGSEDFTGWRCTGVWLVVAEPQFKHCKLASLRGVA